MPRADSHSPTSLTRRAALAAVGTGALAAAVPAVALAASTTTNDDAELIALGKRFDEAIAIHDDHLKRIEATEAGADLSPRFDLDDGWRDDLSDDEARAVMFAWVEKHQAADKVAGIDVLEAQRGQFIDHVLDPLVVLIGATPTTTLAGLAVKARVVQFVASDWWGSPANDLDLEAEHARLLIDDVLAIAGRTA